MKTMFEYAESLYPLVKNLGNYWDSNNADSYTTGTIGPVAESFSCLANSKKDIRQTLATHTLLYASLFVLWDKLEHEELKDDDSFVLDDFEVLSDKCQDSVNKLLVEESAEVKEEVYETLMRNICFIVYRCKGVNEYIEKPACSWYETWLIGKYDDTIGDCGDYAYRRYNTLLIADFLNMREGMFFWDCEKFQESCGCIIRPIRIDGLFDVRWDRIFNSRIDMTDYLDNLVSTGELEEDVRRKLCRKFNVDRQNDHSHNK